MDISTVDSRINIIKNLGVKNGYIERRIMQASSLYFYNSSFDRFNNIQRMTEEIVLDIKKNNAFLIVGKVDSSILSFLSEFEDYVYDHYVGKKIVVFYGNCHTGAVKRYLQTSKEFIENYDIYPVKEIQDVKDPSYFELPVFKVCDVFVHQSIWKKNRYGEQYASENVISKISKPCKVIAMPNVYHLPCCLFPQYYEAKELRYNNQTYFFRDSIIDEGIKQKKCLNEIARKYYETEYDKATILGDYSRFLSTLKKREKDWDISVSSFIESNIKEHQLFYEMNHPTNFLIKYYAEELLKIILQDNYSIGELENYKMDTYQMPMLPSVQSALGLKYSSLNSELRTSGIKLRNLPMDINEYVKEYYACIWMSGEFDLLTRIRSKFMFLEYKIESKLFSRPKSCTK